MVEVLIAVGLVVSAFGGLMWWARGYFVQDIVVWNRPGLAALESQGDEPPDRDTPHVLVRWVMASGRGGLLVERMRWVQPGWDATMEPLPERVVRSGDSQWQDRFRWWRLGHPVYPVPDGSFADRVRIERWGFGVVTGSSDHQDAHGSVTYVDVWLPWAMVVGLLALPGLVWLRRGLREGRRRRRRKAGHCEMCGYDLRASVEGCPECGFGRKAGGYRP